MQDPIATLAWNDKLAAPAEALGRMSEQQQGPVADLLRGKPLGHPLHPALTDLPIGFWTSAMLLDFASLLPGGRFRRASARRSALVLVIAGVVTAVPTALTGLVDVGELPPRKQRVAVVHAASNSVATVLYVLSAALRRRGAHRRGIVVGLIGATAATAGGYLGGHLAFGSDDPPPADEPADHTSGRGSADALNRQCATSRRRPNVSRHTRP